MVAGTAAHTTGRDGPCKLRGFVVRERRRAIWLRMRARRRLAVGPVPLFSAVALLLGAVMVAIVTVPGPATAQVDDLEAPFFWDVNGDPDAGWISSVATAGISTGCDDPFEQFFCPRDHLLREQAAAWLVRALQIPLGTTSDFVDDDASPFEREIAAASAAGIVTGCDDDGPRFCPTDPVTAREFGWMMERAYGVTLGISGADPLPRAEAAALLGPVAGLAEDAAITFIPGVVDSLQGQGLDPLTEYVVILPTDQIFVTTSDEGSFSITVPEVLGPPPATAVIVSEERVWRAPIGLADQVAVTMEFEGTECGFVTTRVTGDDWDPSQPVTLRYPDSWGPAEVLAQPDADGSFEALIGAETETMWAFQARSGGLVVAAEPANSICSAPPLEPPDGTTTTTTTTTTTPPTTTTVASTTTTTASAGPTDQELISAALALIQQRLESGDLIWTVPDEAAAAGNFRVEVSTVVADINQLLREQMGVDGLDTVRSFLDVSVMGDGLDVASIGGSGAQPASAGRWEFDVTAPDEGEATLTLTVSPSVEIDGAVAAGPTITRREVIAVGPADVAVAGTSITQPDDELAQGATTTPSVGEAQPVEPAGVSSGGFGSPIVWIVLALLMVVLLLFLFRNRQHADH